MSNVFDINEKAKRLSALQTEAMHPHLKGDGEGPTIGDMDRIGPLETRIGNLETEVREQFRWTIGVVLGTALALLAAMLTLHVYAIGRVDQVQQAVNALLTKSIETCWN